MKRFLIFICILLGYVPTVTADHIAGGEVYYVFTGMSGGLYKYDVTVRLFMLCSSSRQFNNPTSISIFNKATGNSINDLRIALNRTETIDLDNYNPCISNPPPVCYRVGYYQFSVSLPAAADGYIITTQVLFRVDGMNNLVPNYNQVGATYTANIPSNADVANAPENNSARFSGNDLDIMCAQNTFSYSFAATDIDGDQLRYSFCNAYEANGGGFGNDNTPPPSPPYQSVPYGNGYSGDFPLGDNIRIDPNTGIITGIAPATGTYVVTVCVEEIRDGIVIATQRKDLQINIASCAIAAATLPPEYMLCRDSRTLTAANLSTSPLVSNYNWEFLNNKGATVFTSTDDVVTHTFTDTGAYTIRLYINKGQLCSDSTSAVARVYPGFTPDFDFSGTCINKPVQFTDASTTVFGTVSAWNWNFGESIANGVSTLQNPFYNYSQSGIKNVSLVAANTMGCLDTVFKIVEISDKPPILLAFRDTLICPPDALQLKAIGKGNFNWTPQVDINNTSTPTPVVSPTKTTRYYVELNDDGCINNDSVLVRVVNKVSLQTMADTVICQGDAVQLKIVTNGLRFSWTPSSSLNVANTKNPVAIPDNTTTYFVTSSISSCFATGDVIVNTAPYPVAYAGADTMICFNNDARLHASTDGINFSWSPDPTLTGINTLDPVANPTSSTFYIFYAYDSRGCPKPGIDTVMVTVLPDIEASAGRDTAVVVGQPLQLQATGGVRYLWSPANGLSALDIPNPVALFPGLPPQGLNPYKVVVFNEAGCADSAFIRVKLFGTSPDIFVPSAFTPNSDGRNDFFQPVAAGIQHIERFHVFNRWGQLVYNSIGQHGRGWDGSFNGKPQPDGTFVWILKAVDFTGRPFFKKGTVTLIR